MYHLVNNTYIREQSNVSTLPMCTKYGYIGFVLLVQVLFSKWHLYFAKFFIHLVAVNSSEDWREQTNNWLFVQYIMLFIAVNAFQHFQPFSVLIFLSVFVKFPRLSVPWRIELINSLLLLLRLLHAISVNRHDDGL